MTSAATISPVPQELVKTEAGSPAPSPDISVAPEVPPAPAEIPCALSLPGGSLAQNPAPPRPVLLAGGLKLPEILLQGDEPVAWAPPQETSEAPELSALRSQRPTEPVQAAEEELPDAYGTGRLHLLARDPRCLHVHWDLTLEQQRYHISRSKHPHLTVRVRFDDVLGELAGETHVHPESRSWFLHVDQPARTYVAELGYYDQTGRWRQVSVSDPATTPADTAAQDLEVRFVTVSLEPASSPVREAPAQPPLTFQGTQPVRLPASTGPAPGESAPSPREAPPSQMIQSSPRWEEPPAAAMRPVEPVFPVSKQVVQPDGLGTGHPPPSTEPVDWTQAQEDGLAELLGVTVVRQAWPSSAEIAELLKQHADRGPVPEAVRRGLGQQPSQVSSPAGAEWLQVSSPAGAQAPGAKEFWFIVNAELVIYGATEPSATVSIGGRPIRLRPDGTFSFRFSLPDGHYALPIKAVAVHGDTRRAELQFERQTQYRGEVGVHPQDPALQTPAPEHVG